MIRPMVSADVPAVVRVHLASFPGFFLSSLGPRFLALFYLGICTSADSIRFVHLDGEGVIRGFVAGSAAPRGFYAGLLRRDWLRFGLASLGAVLRRPSVIARLLRAVRQPADSPGEPGTAGLFSIGVDPALQGTGAGSQLVAAFRDAARRRGARRVYLTTDQIGNDAVNAFYRRQGFTVERQFVTPEGRAMNEYWITL